MDCTRIDNEGITSRLGISIEEQIKKISECVNGKIILADDVVFSGSVLKRIIELFKKYNVEVVSIISCISSMEGYNYFKNNLRYGIDTLYLMGNDVIDQVCERDFYFGIAGSGILVRKNNELYKSPYFKPFGDPVNRASIPSKFEKYFSDSCIDRSLYLWESIDKLRSDNTKIYELPERIVDTDNNDEVVKVLRRKK